MTLGAGFITLAMLVSLVAFSGCTRSLHMTYNPAAYRLPQRDGLRAVALGVAKLEDRRAWIDRTEPQSLAYVMQQGSWKFGLTHQGKEYVPVQDLVQAILIDEFKRAGLEQVTAIPEVLTKDAVPAMRTAAEQQRLGYVLGGRIHIFEIVNEVGVWTVTSRRAVSSGEGMGVMHSTNVDRLMNTVFRQVVTSVVEQVAAKLALEPRDVRVRLVWAGR